MIPMNRHVEDALFQCGRERVMHREGRDGVAVAIRYDVPSPATSPDGIERFLVRNASTLDEAGRQVAQAFAKHLRSSARAATEWADRIESALSRAAEEPS